jgi:hypothetical protein
MLNGGTYPDRLNVTRLPAGEWSTRVLHGPTLLPIELVVSLSTWEPPGFQRLESARDLHSNT